MNNRAGVLLRPLVVAQRDTFEADAAKVFRGHLIGGLSRQEQTEQRLRPGVVEGEGILRMKLNGPEPARFGRTPTQFTPALDGSRGWMRGLDRSRSSRLP